MVYKIRFIIFVIIFIALSFLGIAHKGAIETNLLKTLLPEKVIKSTDIIPFANKSASLVKVVFEADSEDSLENLSNNFVKQIDTAYFELNKPDVSSLVKIYTSHPENFLSDYVRELLKSKKYDEMFERSIEALYNPVGIQLGTVDKDPYLLTDDFVMSNRNVSEGVSSINGKYYNYLPVRIKSADGLSPDLVNNKISELVKVQKQLSFGGAKIYLAGTPVHSYFASRQSVIDINIICLLSVLMVIFLTYFYFKNLKLLLPIALSIAFGVLVGYIATKYLFDSFQIITMVFSTTLIGIGIDYSFHYFFTEKINKIFVKKLSYSLLTTIVPFVLLYFTGIEMLKQVAVFIIFGLTGIYLPVLFIYPCLKLTSPKRYVRPNKKIYKLVLIFLFLLSIIGLFRIHFNDELSTLYKPSKALSQAETLYNKVSGYDAADTQIITVKGKSPDDILKKEEKITDNLYKNQAEYISLSKFVPSKSRQKENFELVKNLYSSNLNNYSEILSTQQIQNLKSIVYTPVTIRIDDYSYLKEFMLNDNTSLIFVLSGDVGNIKEPDAAVINIKSDIESYIKTYRIKLLILFPVVLFILAIVLAFIYGTITAVKILIPSFVGILCALLLSALICGEINLFSIITAFLVLGFTMDYSIFRIDSEDKSESAVLVSCITTSFSFLLLAFSGFKLLSSMAIVLFFGITISYIVGSMLFGKPEK